MAPHDFITGISLGTWGRLDLDTKHGPKKRRPVFDDHDNEVAEIALEIRNGRPFVLFHDYQTDKGCHVEKPLRLGWQFLWFSTGKMKFETANFQVEVRVVYHFGSSCFVEELETDVLVIRKPAL